MFITNNTIRHSAKYFLLSLGLTLVACGGGGGGSSDSASVSYSGNTSPATIDDATQAEEIATALFQSSEKNVGGEIASAATISSNQTLDDSSKNTLVEKLKQDALSSLSYAQNNNQVLAASGQALQSGDCVANGVTEVSDGSATTSLTSFSSTSLKSKTTYSNLCVYKAETGAYLILNGSVDITISGANLLASDGAVINEISMNVPSLSVKHTSATGASFTITISESYLFAFTYDDAGNITRTDFSNYTNISSGELVYRFETTVVLVTGGSTTVTFKFYHPTHGVVEYILSGMTFNCDDGSADAGTLTIIGVTKTYIISPTGACDGTYTVALIP